jgi:hypothetical protein
VTALLLAAVLSASPAPADVLDRAAAALERLGRLDAATRKLDEAEAAIAAARSPAQRRAAWRAWFMARHELRRASAR